MGESASRGEPGQQSRVGEAGDSLRAAVERTLAATADSATGAGQRAQDLLDDVVKRGAAAREGVARRGTDATSRLAEAIGELRASDEAGLDDIRERLAAAERRIAALEARTQPRVEPEGRPTNADE